MNQPSTLPSKSRQAKNNSRRASNNSRRAKINSICFAKISISRENSLIRSGSTRGRLLLNRISQSGLTLLRSHRTCELLKKPLAVSSRNRLLNTVKSALYQQRFKTQVRHPQETRV